MGRFRIVWDYFGCFGWGNLQFFGTFFMFWDVLKCFVMFGSYGMFGDVWGHFGCFEKCGCFKTFFYVLGGFVNFLGRFWEVLECFLNVCFRCCGGFKKNGRPLPLPKSSNCSYWYF